VPLHFLQSPPNLAESIIAPGTLRYETGKPLDIRFTAMDGREVDLAKLAGKVVWVEFWSTTCGPCIGEMPTVKAAYEKSHKPDLKWWRSSWTTRRLRCAGREMNLDDLHRLGHAWR
jgi:hypothetical protein